jgi:hypothetical protein
MLSLNTTVTSCRFSRKGRGTFLPFVLSSSSSTLQYQSTLCATEANSLHFFIRKLKKINAINTINLLLDLILAIISQALKDLGQILKYSFRLYKLHWFKSQLVQKILTVVLESKILE